MFISAKNEQPKFICILGLIVAVGAIMLLIVLVSGGGSPHFVIFIFSGARLGTNCKASDDREKWTGNSRSSYGWWDYGIVQAIKSVYVPVPYSGGKARRRNFILDRSSYRSSVGTRWPAHRTYLRMQNQSEHKLSVSYTFWKWDYRPEMSCAQYSSALAHIKPFLFSFSAFYLIHSYLFIIWLRINAKRERFIDYVRTTIEYFRF